MSADLVPILIVAAVWSVVVLVILGSLLLTHPDPGHDFTPPTPKKEDAS